jgi:hypothetical protein
MTGRDERKRLSDHEVSALEAHPSRIERERRIARIMCGYERDDGKR